MKELTIILGLCKGRHEMPVEDYIFEQEINPTDVSGITDVAYSKLRELYPECRVVTTCMPNQADYTDVPVYKRGHLDLYATGLTVALIAVINVCKSLGIDVVLYHYDRESGEYYPQHVW